MAGRPSDPSDGMPEGAPEGVPGREGSDEHDLAGSDEAAWRAIVANFGDRAELDPAELEPVAEELPAYETDGDESGEERFVDEGERFVPPPPAPITLRPDRTAAWAGVLGAPVLALVLVAIVQTTSLRLPGWVGLILAAAFLGGFGYLVATMPKAPEDPWDDGARL